MKTVLVTGGSGFIGTHTDVELLSRGFQVIVVDNLSNSSEEALRRVERITGKKVKFYKTDLLDEKKTEEIFQENKIDFVIHFAAYKAVGESVADPIKYYENNLGSTLVLLKLMKKYGVKNLIFSSSATVYGNPERLPLTEDCRADDSTNPYGETKVMIERMLMDVAHSDPSWNIILLRYFNPIGAHESGLIGENPKGIPANLMPYISKVALGKLDHLTIYGNDYDTKDGTGVRDYIHVMDLASGHVAAIEHCEKPGIHIYNLGTGHGVSVLEMVNAFMKATGVNVKYAFGPRRPGDIASCYASSEKAEKELGWKAKYSLEDMMRDQWNWQSKNPNGYDK
ncbi:MAG: UDP-glucose 4-epimerase GalE [Bacilli bacterium]